MGADGDEALVLAAESMELVEAQEGYGVVDKREPRALDSCAVYNVQPKV